MASSTFFCHPIELIEGIDLIRRQFDLHAVIFAVGQEGALLIGSRDPLVLPARSYRLFLIHGETVPLKIGEMRSKERGFIDIVPGALVISGGRQILTLTCFEAERGEGANMDGAKMVRWFKRQMKFVIKFGVYGVGEDQDQVEVGGGGHVYRDIGYTPEALKLWRSGVVWKQESSFRAIFKPANFSEGPIS